MVVLSKKERKEEKERRKENGKEGGKKEREKERIKKESSVTVSLLKDVCNLDQPSEFTHLLSET